jgi:hypothetical protein
MPLKITPKTFGAAFSAARKRGDKTFEFKGKKFTTQTKEEKDREVTPEAKKSWTRRAEIVKATSVLKPVKLMLLWKRPEERGAMNLEGFKRDKKDMAGSGEYSPFKKGGSVNPQPPSVPTVLQCVARPVEGWCNRCFSRR